MNAYNNTISQACRHCLKKADTPQYSLCILSVSDVHVGHDIGDDEDNGEDEEDGESYGEEVAGKLAASLGSAPASALPPDCLLNVALSEAVDGVTSLD